MVTVSPGAENCKRIVIRCKGCRENIPAPVESVPSQPIAAACPLCGEHWRYVPSDVFLGRFSHLIIRLQTDDTNGSRPAEMSARGFVFFLRHSSRNTP